MTWKSVPNATGYFVNDLGQLRNPAGRIWPGTKTSQGYYELCLTNRTYRRLVHIIVAELFLAKPFEATEVNHKDGNKHNNNVGNLEWVTHQENMLHANTTMKLRDATKTYRKVRQYAADGTLLAEYESVKAACIALGKNPRSPLISYACNGKCSTNNCNTAYGYKWSYAE